MTDDDNQLTRLSFAELCELLGVDRTPDEENPFMLGAVRSYEAWAKRLVEERDGWLRRRKRWEVVITAMRKCILRAWRREDA